MIVTTEPLLSEHGKMQNEPLLAKRKDAIKAICLQEKQNQHQIKFLWLFFICCDKCFKSVVLQPSWSTIVEFIYSEGNKEPATPQLTEAYVSDQCEKPYLELLGSEGKRERHRVRQTERHGGGAEKYISNIMMWKAEVYSKDTRRGNDKGHFRFK